MSGEEDKDLPLHDEAQARDKWREGETIVEGGSKRTGLPASEVDDARLDGGADEDDGRPGKGSPGTIPPPD